MTSAPEKKDDSASAPANADTNMDDASMEAMMQAAMEEAPADASEVSNVDNSVAAVATVPAPGGVN